MPKPAKSARRCSLQQLPSFEEGRSSSSMETVSLFEMKRVYGWWPCVAQDPGEEMQLTVWTNCKFSLKFAAHFFQFYFGEFGCSSKQDPKGDYFDLDRGENGQFNFCLRSAQNTIRPRSSVEFHTRQTKFQFESIQKSICFRWIELVGRCKFSQTDSVELNVELIKNLIPSVQLVWCEVRSSTWA